jgi:cadmium resistance protein CadD (predicted permease)
MPGMGLTGYSLPYELLLRFTCIAILLFASTNLDDIFVLVGFFADCKYHTREIVAGQLVGIASLFGVSMGVSLLSLVIALPYLGLLGVAPILIGSSKLRGLFRKQEGERESVEPHLSGLRYGKLASVAAVTVANGADNLAVYTPSFAIRSRNELTVIALVFAIMTVLWCFLAHAVVKHPTLGAPIRHYGHRIAPAVLICLGVLILYQAGSFGLLHIRASSSDDLFSAGL